jgi:hypothetical protein
MGRDQLLEDFPWFSITPPRRLTIVDLMIGVVVAALGSSVLAVTFRASWNDDERAVFGMLALIVVGSLAAQRGLAAIPIREPRSGRSVFLGIVSYGLAMVTYLCLFLLAAVSPEGAALVVITLLVLAVYLTTWD